MQPIISYLIKMGLCLAIGYAFYFLLLRRMTWYTWNRYFLLCFPLATLAIPAVQLRLPESIQTSHTGFYITDILPSAIGQTSSATASAKNIQWTVLDIAFVILLTGMLFFLCRFVLRICSLYRTRRMARLLHAGDVKLYHLKGCGAPFSFYDAIYLDTEHYDQQELENIIEHELVHVTQKHTLDILVAEILCIIQWFNPVAWLMKHAMKQNLEFIADDHVLSKGISRKGYQYLLLKVSGAMPQSIATNLLFPSLKKRIHMMNKDRTRKSQLLKFLFLIPVACLLVVIFSTRSGNRPAHSSTDEFSVSSVSFYINDEQAAQIIRKEQANSLLKEGGMLSLALISEEKVRLKTLLERNGYDTSGGRSISFVMDTSLTSRSFTVKVVVDALPKQQDLSPGSDLAGTPQAYRTSDKEKNTYQEKVLVAREPVAAIARDNTAIPMGPSLK